MTIFKVYLEGLLDLYSIFQKKSPNAEVALRHWLGIQTGRHYDQTLLMLAVCSVHDIPFAYFYLFSSHKKLAEWR